MKNPLRYKIPEIFIINKTDLIAKSYDMIYNHYDVLDRAHVIVTSRAN